jgi:hypothetical protein
MQPPAHAGSSLEDFSTLKMEAIRSSKMSVHTRSARRHIPEDGIHSHRRENLKSYIFLFLLLVRGETESLITQAVILCFTNPGWQMREH